MAFTRPTKDQLATLTPMERAAFEIGDFWSRYLVVPSKAWNTAFMGFMLWATSGRRLHVHGIEHLAKFKNPDRVLIVCNHRSFFDFYVITKIVFFHTHLSHRIIFPVRSSFFYDHPLGPFVNAAMSGMRMFPPVMRSESVRRRATFNEYSVQRSVEELNTPGTEMGLHPEGTRIKNADPYKLLRARGGVGRIALGCPRGAHHPRVHPRDEQRPAEGVREERVSPGGVAHRLLLRAGGVARRSPDAAVVAGHRAAGVGAHARRGARPRGKAP